MDGNIEREMELLTAQQAQSAVRIREIERIIVSFAQVTRDRFQGTDERVDDVNEKIAAVVDSQVRAEERGREIDKKIAALVDSQVRAEQRGREIDKKIAALVDSQGATEESVKDTRENVKKTDEALRKLTTVVDRYISRRRNGDSDDKL